MCITDKASAAPPTNPLQGWPAGVQRIEYRSSGDDTLQPAMFYAPTGDQPVPLLVALHTWSIDYAEPKHPKPYVQWCKDNGWAFVYPNFRGPNWTPEALGSDLVVADVLSAVEYAKAHAKIDASRVYLCGASGGGLATLLVAGRAPEAWTAASAWVPISDVAAWYDQCRRRGLAYAEHIVKACGGVPLPGLPAQVQCRKRSPLTYLAKAKGLPIDINAGIHDGHGDASVPISHTLNAFNALADEKDRLTDAQVAVMTDQQTIPSELGQPESDPRYGRKAVLFRRQSGQARVTIFEGGHEIVYTAALEWLGSHRRSD